MKKIAIVVILFSFQIGFSQSTSSFFTKADQFFKTHVSYGRVDYKNIKKDPSSLDELINMAAGITVSTSDPKTYQAFYINAYNLAVIKGIT